MCFRIADVLLLNFLCSCLNLAGLHLVGAQQNSRLCDANDFLYTYTQCDVNNKRWRVSVPKEGIQCVGGSPPLPIRGAACDEVCAPGQYLDIGGEQSCLSCDAGMFSLGGGQRWDRWDSLPSLFSQAKKYIPLLDTIGCFNATSGQWKPMGEHLTANLTGCGATLTWKQDIVYKGKVTIVYRNTYASETIALLEVVNLCADNNKPIIEILKQTAADEWRTFSVDLKVGTNKIAVDIYNFKKEEDVGLLHTFAIKSISVDGLQMSSECTPCPAGTYSSTGSSICTPCPENTFAKLTGSDRCQSCGSGEYALPGAKECLPRPSCTASDYMPSYSACQNGTMRREHKWSPSSHCNPADAASVQLPPPDAFVPCAPCNPGQEIGPHGNCTYCEKGFYSVGTSLKCEACPLETETINTLTFSLWKELPAQMQTSCINAAEGKVSCGVAQAWKTADSFIQSSTEMDDNSFAILSATVDGLSPKPLDGQHYGTMELDFETICTGGPSACLFMILVDDGGSNGLRVLRQWKASVNRTTFSYDFTRPSLSFISFAFRKQLESNNVARIYSLKLTNTLIGGATECRQCMVGSDSQSGCKGCASGERIKVIASNHTRTCEACPENAWLVDRTTCSPCPPGLRSTVDKSSCISNCSLARDGKRFDFRSFQGIQTVDGSHLFEGDGSAYYNVFNFALCSSDGDEVLVSCNNNASGVSFREDQTVSASVCRETILPSDNIVAIQPISIGDRLLNITVNDALERKSLADGQVKFNDDAITVHFNFVGPSTSQCLKGRTSTITLVCDPMAEGNGTKSLPPMCPAGTCDGCHFMLIWRSANACPVCLEEDFEEVKSECNAGKQVIHYIPPKYCPASKVKAGKVVKCSLLTLPVMIAIGVSASIAVILLAVIVCCWKRAKKLEYKYMKLVEGASGKDGELPAAETCALSEDEDDIKVNFKAHGNVLFGKKGKDGIHDGFEKMKLVGSSLSDI